MTRKNTCKKFPIWTIVIFFVIITITMYNLFEGASPSIIKKENNCKELPRINDLLTNEMSSIAATAEMDRAIKKYLKRWEINGAQIAVSRNDSLVYAKGFGWADKEKHKEMKPENIMRVASVSKLLTAVGIMKLVEMGKIRLTDKVFGPYGILNDTTITNVIVDKRHFDITVEQLLRHKAGFTRYAGDPMFSTRYIMMQNHLSSPPDHYKLLQIVLKRHLGYTPGEAQKYSNIGYTLLSLIIEKCSGLNYEKFMQNNVFYPAGCFDFKIAGNYLKDRYPREVKYYMHKEAELIEEFNNSGRMVVKCYGENDIPLLLGAGAWCGSAAELCHFVSAIDGDVHYPDILTKESVDIMTQEMSNHQFSLGWNFTPCKGPWVRTGTLSGTSALVVYYPDTKQCWVLLTNTSTWKGQGFAKDTMTLFEKLRHKYGLLMKPLCVEYKNYSSKVVIK